MHAPALPKASVLQLNANIPSKLTFLSKPPEEDGAITVNVDGAALFEAPRLIQPGEFWKGKWGHSHVQLRPSAGLANLPG